MDNIDRSDILLAIVAAAKPPGLGRGHLQKAAFLVGDEYPSLSLTNYYEFEKGQFGPFAAAVYSDAETLDKNNHINIVPRNDPGQSLYELTEKGQGKRIYLPEGMTRSIEDIVKWIEPMGFSELVRAIYLLYPEYLENSKFDYNESLAIQESLDRSIKDIEEGNVYTTDQLLSR